MDIYTTDNLVGYLDSLSSFPFISFLFFFLLLV